MNASSSCFPLDGQWVVFSILPACFTLTYQQFCLEKFGVCMCDTLSLIVSHVGVFLFQSPGDLYTSCGPDMGQRIIS